MNGNLLNNKQINELVENKTIKISPNYDVKKLQIAQYPLTPSVIWSLENENKTKVLYKYNDENLCFFLQPKSYYLIDISEDIILPLEISGRFIPSSNLIEKGLILTSGKIEYPYGLKKEKIRFGVYNCLDFAVKLERNTRIAYVQFFDLRGQDSLNYTLSDFDKTIYNKRVYQDFDGPNYEADNDS